MFERLDITTASRLRPRPLREPRFIADGHLGKLARHLRLLGFDAAYLRDAPDEEIAARAAADRRIVLTRDVGLLKPSAAVLQMRGLQRRARGSRRARRSRCVARRRPRTLRGDRALRLVRAFVLARQPLRAAGSDREEGRGPLSGASA
jgi:hypothetical protein